MTRFPDRLTRLARHDNVVFADPIVLRVFEICMVPS